MTKLNKDVLMKLYPKTFRKRTFAGILLFGAAIFLGAMTFGCIIGIPWLIVSYLYDGGDSALLQAFGILVVGGITACLGWCCYLHARGAFNPSAHSMAARRLLYAKELHESGLLETERAPVKEQTSMSFSNYTLFQMVSSHEGIDKSKHYEDYLLLVQSMKDATRELIDGGVFTSNPSSP